MRSGRALSVEICLDSIISMVEIQLDTIEECLEGGESERALLVTRHALDSIASARRTVHERQVQRAGATA